MAQDEHGTWKWHPAVVQGEEWFNKYGGEEWFNKYDIWKWHPTIAQGEEWFNKYGTWKWHPAVVQSEEWFNKYQALLHKWNEFVPEYSAVVSPKNVGRLLAASEAQCAQVIKFHKPRR